MTLGVSAEATCVSGAWFGGWTRLLPPPPDCRGPVQGPRGGASSGALERQPAPAGFAPWGRPSGREPSRLTARPSRAASVQRASESPAGAASDLRAGVRARAGIARRAGHRPAGLAAGREPPGHRRASSAKRNERAVAGRGASRRHILTARAVGNGKGSLRSPSRISQGEAGGIRSGLRVNAGEERSDERLIQRGRRLLRRPVAVVLVAGAVAAGRGSASPCRPGGRGASGRSAWACCERPSAFPAG